MAIEEYPDSVIATTIENGRYQPLVLRDGDTIYIPDRCVSGKFVPRRVVLGCYCPKGYVPLWSERSCEVFLYKIPNLVYTKDPSHA